MIGGNLSLKRALKVSQVNISDVERLPDTIDVRHNHSACWLGEKSIVLTGGFNPEIGEHIDKCEILDSGKWKPLPDLNQARGGHSSSAFNNHSVYVFCGGSYLHKELNPIERWAIGE